MAASGTPLTGGRITAGVVRIGDTVRRPLSADRTQVHALLVHLEDKRFAGTPRFAGIDDENREILSYLDGETPTGLGPYADPQLAAAAALLRRFHDATADFPAVRQSGAEVMCHNDWGPPNAVFCDGLPFGLIDFDTLAPGMRLWDLGYSAFAWLDLGNKDYSGGEQLRRLTVFAQGYGLAQCTPAAIAVTAVARQTALAVSGRLGDKPEMAAWAADAAEWTIRNLTEKLAPTGYGLDRRVFDKD